MHAAAGVEIMSSVKMNIPMITAFLSLSILAIVIIHIIISSLIINSFYGSGANEEEVMLSLSYAALPDVCHSSW
jgi:hypothetical protein